MTRLIPILFFIILAFFSCKTETQNNELETTIIQADSIPDNTAVESKISGIKGEDIVLRKGPGEKANKIINEKATQVLGETQYCEVDYSTKVEILETDGNWVKIKVVDPEWLLDSHVGWILSKYLVSREDQENEVLGKLNPGEYEILSIKHNSRVDNFNVLLKRKGFDKEYAYQFIKQFRKENCKSGCNVNLYDSRVVENLIDVYPLPDEDYLKMADHLISMSTFDAPEIHSWYPYQDFHYKELGGRNWKKDPIK